MTRTVAVLLVAALVAASGCIMPESQSTKASKDKLARSHFEVKCPVSVTAAGGLQMDVKECTFTLTDGKRDATLITCTGLQASANTPKLNREGSLTVTYFTPIDGHDTTKTYKMATESGDSHTATCSIKGVVDAHGTYEVQFKGGCLKESVNPFSWKLKNDDCSAKDTAKLTRYGSVL